MSVTSRLNRLLLRAAGRSPLPPGVLIGERVHLGSGVAVDWSHAHHVTIGDDAVLAPGVRILAHDASSRRHAGVTWVAPVEIGPRAFVGANSVILPGVKVGEDAVVGAGSVVVHDVPAGEVHAGNPARFVSTSQALHEKRLAAARAGFRVLDERLYNVHPLDDERVSEMRALADQDGGYFLGELNGKHSPGQ